MVELDLTARHPALRRGVSATVYSSLNYLREFPISELKVDCGFIAGLNGGGSGTVLVRAVANLGQALDLMTVAEGIETAQQYAQVRALGFALAQGDHLSRPLEAGAARVLAQGAGPLVIIGVYAAGKAPRQTLAPRPVSTGSRMCCPGPGGPVACAARSGCPGFQPARWCADRVAAAGRLPQHRLHHQNLNLRFCNKA